MHQTTFAPQDHLFLSVSCFVASQGAAFVKLFVLLLYNWL